MKRKEVEEHWSEPTRLPSNMRQRLPDLSSAQEGFEHYAEPNANDDGHGGWADPKKVRVARPIGGGRLNLKEVPLDGTPDNVDWSSMDYEVAQAAAGNDPPSWTDQRDQMIQQDQMALRQPQDYSGRDRGGLASGFTVHRMDAAEGKHDMDERFDQRVVGEDEGGPVRGFAKRSNVLDRG
jgi:hypothetical protein